MLVVLQACWNAPPPTTTDIAATPPHSLAVLVVMSEESMLPATPRALTMDVLNGAYDPSLPDYRF